MKSVLDGRTHFSDPYRDFCLCGYSCQWQCFYQGQKWLLLEEEGFTVRETRCRLRGSIWPWLSSPLDLWRMKNKSPIKTWRIMALYGRGVQNQQWCNLWSNFGNLITSQDSTLMTSSYSLDPKQQVMSRCVRSWSCSTQNSIGSRRRKKINKNAPNGFPFPRTNICSSTALWK